MAFYNRLRRRVTRMRRTRVNLTTSAFKEGAQIALAIRLTLILLTALSTARADESLAILPAKFTLNGPAARQQLVLERMVDNHFVARERSLTTGSSVG